MKFHLHCVFCPFLLLLLLLWIRYIAEASHEISLAYQSVSAVQLLNQEHRTAFHFQPKKHWLNDPNGPMYYKGIYHIFYQYNPKGAVWGNIVWAHSVSKDLINWEALEHALYPTNSFDKYGCWSGSATILPGNKPIILYTGVVDESQKKEVQNYAIPANFSDPYLRKWIKPNDNPLITVAGDDSDRINETAFRDPTTSWMGRDGYWRILIGSRRKNRGIAYLYRSKDFKKWTKAKHPLHSTANTGNWECPDFFPTTTTTTTKINKHVLKVSLDTTRYDYYTIGKYYAEIDRYIPDKTMIDGVNGLRFDYGNFYASKSFFDPTKNRRVVWGWVNESDTKFDDVRKGWAGILGIPRTVWLHPNGKQLLLWPVKEVETLRGEKSVNLRNKIMNKGNQIHIKGITAAQADIEVTFSFSSLDKAEEFEPRWSNMDAQKLCAEKGSTVQGGLGPFGLLILASENLEEYTPVFFRVFKTQNHHRQHLVLMCSDASSSSLTKGLYKPSFAGFLDLDMNKNNLSLRSLIDHSVVESFGEGGKVCITSRVYPTLAIFDEAHLHVFNNGTETITVENLHAWSIHRPQFMN